MDTDHRTDIFSFGVVLYELLAGRSPFRGVHEAAIMYEIVNVDPVPISSFKPEVDPELDAIVLECMAKDLEERYQSAKELSKDLKRFKRESSRQRLSRISAAREPYRPSQITAPETPEVPQTWLSKFSSFVGNRIWMITTAIFFLALVGSLIFLFSNRAIKEISTVRFSISPPEKVSVTSARIISPDGQRIAFAATDSAGKTLLWVRPLDQLTMQPLAGTDDANYPFWSADSRFIGFFSRGKLKKVEASGGPVETLCDAPNFRGGAWTRDGVILFAPTNGGPLFKVLAAGGEPTPVTALDSSRQDASHRWPFFLPDGYHFLYYVSSALEEKRGIYVGSLKAGETQFLLKTSTQAMYSPSRNEKGGYLLFVREGTLMAQRFDDQGLKTLGDAFPIVEKVALRTSFNTADFSISENGTLAYQSGGAISNHLVWFNRTGKQLGAIAAEVSYQYPNLSPDERRVVAEGEDQSGALNIWLIDLARVISTRFTFFPTSIPIWSPDGSKIVYTTQSGGAEVLYQKTSSGAGKDEELYRSPDLHKHPTDWSRDGKFILYDNLSLNSRTRYDLYVLSLTGDRKPIPYLQSPFEERQGQFSPDGKLVAYVSDESGKFEIYVQPFPATGAKWQISRDGGVMPRWRKDGKELYFIAPDKKLMAVQVKPAPTFEYGLPQPLFETRSINLSFNVGIEYAVTGDGQRFLVSMPVTGAASAPMTVVLNWEAGVKKK